MADPVADARALLARLDDPSADDVDEGKLAAALQALLDFIPAIETRAIAGMIGMDPGQGSPAVREAVRDRLRDRRAALDELREVLQECRASYIVHDGKIIRCSTEVAEAFQSLKPGGT